MSRFETYTKFRDFKVFHIEQAKGFKASLAEQTSTRTKDRLSKATLYATLSALKRFFIWLAGQPGYKSRIAYSDANISTFQPRKSGSLKHTGKRAHLLLSKSDMPSVQCPLALRSNAVTEPSLPSRS